MFRKKPVPLIKGSTPNHIVNETLRKADRFNPEISSFDFQPDYAQGGIESPIFGQEQPLPYENLVLDAMYDLGNAEIAFQELKIQCGRQLVEQNRPPETDADFQNLNAYNQAKEVFNSDFFNPFSGGGLSF